MNKRGLHFRIKVLDEMHNFKYFIVIPAGALHLSRQVQQYLKVGKAMTKAKIPWQNLNYDALAYAKQLEDGRQYPQKRKREK